MYAQRGITLTGFLFFSVLAVTVLLLGFKIGPAYLEYYTIQKVLRDMAAEPALQAASRGEINSAFNAKANIAYVKAISSEDLEVSKNNGRQVFSASYSVRVPLFYNLSACMDFNPTSDK